MPGENCSVYGCSTSRRHKGVPIWKLPTASSPFNAKWRADLLCKVTKEKIAGNNKITATKPVKYSC